jgi:glycogen synthase
MRILHFSWEYPPIMYGGLGAHVLALTREQAKQGHDVVVVTQGLIDSEASRANEVVDGVRVIRAGNAYPDAKFEEKSLDRWSYGFALGSARAASSELKSWFPEIIHGHDWVGAEQSRLVSETSGSPIVITIHATEMGRHQGWLTSRISRIVNAREIQAIRQADQIIVCSDYMKRELETSLLARHSRISIIPNGVNIADFQIPNAHNEAMNKVEDSDFIIGFLGRTEWEKGAHHVIDSLKFLSETKFKVRIVGDGSQIDALRQKVERNGFQDRVKFYGKVSAAEKQRLLGGCDVLVIPSSYEPFGIVALEAGAARVPVIAARVGGLHEILPDSRFGFPLETVDGSEIAKRIREISLQPEAALEASERFFDRIRDTYTWTAIAEATESLYRRVIEVKSRA